VGCLWLATSHLLTALFAALGLAAVDLGLRTGRRTLGIHGVLFLLGACASAGLLPAAGRALFAPAGSAMPAPGLAAAGAFAACLAAYVGLVRRAATLPGGGFWPRLVLACCLGWSVAGSTTLALVGGLSWLAGRSLGAGAQATSRTAVLSALAIALSALARRVSARELALLAPTVLVVTGVKLVVEDFQQGHPASIFLTLALYGGALIATSRLGRN
jgi:hypothetical protein